MKIIIKKNKNNDNKNYNFKKKDGFLYKREDNCQYWRKICLKQDCFSFCKYDNFCIEHFNKLSDKEKNYIKFKNKLYQ